MDQRMTVKEAKNQKPGTKVTTFLHLGVGVLTSCFLVTIFSFGCHTFFCVEANSAKCTGIQRTPH